MYSLLRSSWLSSARHCSLQLRFQPFRRRNPQKPPQTSIDSSAHGAPRTTRLNTSSSSFTNKAKHSPGKFGHAASQRKEKEKRLTLRSLITNSQKASLSAIWLSRAERLLLTGKIPMATTTTSPLNAPEKPQLA